MCGTIKQSLETPQPGLSNFPYILTAFQNDCVGELTWVSAVYSASSFWVPVMCQAVFKALGIRYWPPPRPRPHGAYILVFQRPSLLIPILRKVLRLRSDFFFFSHNEYWQNDSRPQIQISSWKPFSCLEKRSFVFDRAKEGHKMNCLLVGYVSERSVCGRWWPWATEIFRSETQRTPGNSFGSRFQLLPSYLL